MNKQERNLLLGFTFSNLFSIVIIGMLYLITRDLNLPTLLGWSTFLGVPFIMGLICAVFWRDEKIRTVKLLGRILLNMLMAFALAMVFLHEGVFCLLIVSPLIFSIMLLGYYSGRTLVKKRSNTMNFSAAGLLLMLFVSDMLVHHQYRNEVSDTIVIHAAPEKVWNYVVAFPPIEEPAHYWFFNIGLPKPICATVTGRYQGARRKCIFEKNLVFDEVMSTYDPEKNLTFDVTEQPKDPEIMGHINIERGQFILKDNHDGTTTLTGNSWYSLNVFPSTYFDIWARSVTRNVHLRVMEHIRKLCER